MSANGINEMETASVSEKGENEGGRAHLWAQAISDERLEAVCDEFRNELDAAMYQAPQWQKHPREMIAICEELKILRSQKEDIGNYHDAYRGAREDMLHWKRRALEAEKNVDNLAEALARHVNGRTFMGEPLIAPAITKVKP